MGDEGGAAMTGRPSKMPDDFQDHFVDWLVGDVTQSEIAEKLNVRQSTVSNWIGYYKELTGLDRGTKGEGILAEATLDRYANGEITQREGGEILGVSHTAFGKYAREHAKAKAPNDLAANAKTAYEASNALLHDTGKQDVPRAEPMR